MKKILFFIISIFFFLSFVSAQEEENLVGVEVNYKNGEISIKNIYFHFGHKTENNVNGKYNLELFDKENNILDKISFNFPIIILASDPTWFDSETNEQIIFPSLENIEKDITLYLQYGDDINEITISSDDEELKRVRVIDFGLYCGDNFCQSHEDYNACPKDCGGFRDDLCDGVADGVCDPDCREMDDGDCGDNPSVERFVWKNAYGEYIKKAQIGMTVKMIIENEEHHPDSTVFEIFDSDPGYDDKIRTLEEKNEITGNIDTGKNEFIADWQITQEDYDAAAGGFFENYKGFYFKFNKFNSVNLEIISSDSEAVFCKDYDESYCESCSDFTCPVARNTLSLLFDSPEFEGVVCGESYKDGDYIMDCFCRWDSSKNSCNSGYRLIPPSSAEKIGECLISDESTDDCSDGFMDFSLSAIWNWYDEDNKIDLPRINEKCADKISTAPCLEQIKLPFFTGISFIITLVVIGLIYLFFKRKRVKK